MRKQKKKELPDPFFDIFARVSVAFNEERGRGELKAIDQRNYLNLVEAKGENYLRDFGITPPEQWDDDSFQRKSGQLREVYQREYHAQEEAKREKVQRRNNYLFGVGISLVAISVMIGTVQDVLRRVEYQKKDYWYCQNLSQNAQLESSEVREFVRRNATAPYSGRLCELVLAEEEKLR